MSLWRRRRRMMMMEIEEDARGGEHGVYIGLGDGDVY